MNSRNTADEDAVRTLASLAGFARAIVHRIDSLELVEDLIVAGYGVGLLPLDRPTAPASGCCPCRTPRSSSARTPSPGAAGRRGRR